MAPTILTMPAEILLEIAFLLDLNETYQLRNTSKGLFKALNGEEFNQEVAKHYFSYSKEAQLAKQGVISYSIAIQRIFRRRKALSLARPCSVVVLARGGGLGYYNEGYMSYIQEHTIRILDVHNASPTENIVHLKGLLDQEADRWPPEVGDLRRIGNNLGTGDNEAVGEPDHYEPIINYYHNGMISIFLRKGKYHICAIINVQKNVPSTFRRVRLMFGFYGINPQSRFTGRHLFLATNRNLLRDSHSKRRRPLNGIDEWVVWRFDLEVPERPPSTLHLAGFSGGNFRGNACSFDIYSGWFYALCPIDLPVSADNKEAFYCCYRIPVEDFCTKPTRSCEGTGAPWPDEASLRPMQSFKIPRPCEGNGIIMKAEELAVIRDEQSGNLVIAEDREEWGWEADTRRSCYYFQQICLPDPSARGVASESMIADMVQNLPEGDVAHAIQQHPYPRFYYNVAINKRHYVQPSSAFITTVSSFETADESSSQQRFHLYVSSRPFTAPIDSQVESLRGSESTRDGILSASHYETQLAKTPMRRFPSKNAPKELTDLLNSFSNAHDWVGSAVDERSVIVLHGETDLLRCKTTGFELHLINFDPWIRFPGLRKIDLNPLSDVVSYEDHKKEMERLRNWGDLKMMAEEKRERGETEQALKEGARNENRDETSTRDFDHPFNEARPSDSQGQTAQDPIDAVASKEPQSTRHRDNDPMKEREVPDPAHEAANAVVSKSSSSSTSTLEDTGEQELSNCVATPGESNAGGSASHQLLMDTEKDSDSKSNGQTSNDTNLDDVNDLSGADAASPENNVGTDTWFWTEEAQWVGIKRGYQFY